MATDYASLDKKMDYEEKSIPVRTVAGWVFGLLFGLCLTMGLMLLIYGYPQAHPDGATVMGRKMLQPTLQPEPARALKEFKKKQKAALTSYGWIDKQQGVVRIPIDVAMEQALAKKIFPVEGKK